MDERHHDKVWCYTIENGQLMSIWSEGAARDVAERYKDEYIYFFAELVETPLLSEHVGVEHLPYARELTTRLPYTESKLRQTLTLALGEVSACWENLEGAGVFESTRAVEIANRLCADVIRITKLGEPSLGCATTAELMEELTARMSLNGILDERPVD